ncbi:MAG: WD40 repeat domain-containing protein [Planctomycetia bacterium]|nr:WD40 repeat domain-containing protein [Planctomycetia bacterium]
MPTKPTMHRFGRGVAPARIACHMVVGVMWVAGYAAVAADPPAAATTLTDHRGWVIAGEYSRDGQVIVTAGGDSLLYRPGSVIAWKADGSRIGDFAGHPTAVWSVRISDDGRLAATAGYDGLVKLWDVATRASKHDLRKHKGWVRSVAFAPDGKRLATAGEDGNVILWDTDTGAEVKAIAAHTGAATTVAFSRDGQTLASGGSDKLVKLWNPATGEEKGKLEGHGDAIWSVAYSPDGGRLASGGADRMIKVWTTSDAKEYASFAGHKDWVTSLAFAADGTRLASGSLDGAVKLWDLVAKGEQEGPAATTSSVWSVAFAPDGKTILVGSHAGARLLPTPAAKLLPPPPPPPAAPPSPPQPAVAAAPAAPLVPKEFKSMAGATATISADGIVTVSGPLAKDTYTLKATLPAGVKPQAFQIEALTDPALPQQGPGRAGNGNFVLSTFAVLAGPAGANDASQPVKFSAAKADFEQANYPATAAIDDKADTGWAISGGIGQPHTATFTIAPDAALAPGAPVAITIDHQYADGQHALGKFRISLIPAAAAEPVKTP